jgi:murein DD-endopeptidase MepM/ murein hydrolase activator NlpD
MEELLAARAAAAAAAAEAAAAEAAKAAQEAAEMGVDSPRLSSGFAEAYLTVDDEELAAFLAGKKGLWIRPVEGGVTSPYGPREIICNAAGCSNSFHDGVDFGAACGTPINAVSAGRVVAVGPAGGYGNRVVVYHGAGIESIYGHLQDELDSVAVGDLIEPGTVIGHVGETGVASGCHLDLKIRSHGDYVSPSPFFAERGVQL